jgi:hypothetical protein
MGTFSLAVDSEKMTIHREALQRVFDKLMAVERVMTGTREDIQAKREAAAKADEEVAPLNEVFSRLHQLLHSRLRTGGT